MSVHRLRSAVGFVALLGVLAAAPASAAQFVLAPNQVAIGAVGRDVTHAADTMMDVARRHDIGYAELMTANPGINPWLPGEDTPVVIPGQFILPNPPRTGIVVDLGERRIFYFHPDGKTVETFPIGIGSDNGMTPIGVTTVVRKEPNPTWYPPPSIHAEEPDLPAFVRPGPDNPLGKFALHLGWKNFLIHGTNKPDGVGRNVSHGCIRMYPEDIDRLFHEVTVGTRVRTVDQPVLAGWIDGRLYVEVHPNHDQIGQIDNGDPMTPSIPDDLVGRVADAAGAHHDQVDWNAVERAGLARTGLLMPVTPKLPDVAASTPLRTSAPAASPAVDHAKFDAADGNVVVDHGPYLLPAVPPVH